MWGEARVVRGHTGEAGRDLLRHGDAVVATERGGRMRQWAAGARVTAVHTVQTAVRAGMGQEGTGHGEEAGQNRGDREPLTLHTHHANSKNTRPKIKTVIHTSTWSFPLEQFQHIRFNQVSKLKHLVQTSELSREYLQICLNDQTHNFLKLSKH